MNWKEEIDKLEKLILSENFTNHRWLGNEIPFYIFDYNPKLELLVREQVEFIIKRCNNRFSNKIVNFDLYDILLSTFIQNWVLFEDICELEKETNELNSFITTLTSFTNWWFSWNQIIDYIVESSKNYEIVFLTWVGKIRPIFRSHTILNRLHNYLASKNLVMFFPWEYNSVELKLFWKFKDDNYYRAFRLTDIM